MPNNNGNNEFNIQNLKRTTKNNEYSLFDIKNLEEANKQMQQMILNNEKFITDTQERLKLHKKVSDFDKNLMADFIKQNKEMTKQLDINVEKIEQMTQDWNRYIKSTLKGQENSQQMVKSILAQERQNTKPLPRSISEAFRQVLLNRNNLKEEQAVNSIYQKAVDSVTGKYKRQGADFTDPNVINKMEQEIKEKTLAGMDKITTKFGTKAELFNVAVDTFKKATEVWGRVFTKGMNNQITAYENSFTNLSVRNGITRQNYYDAQWRLNNRLSEMGLNNNIASSEVQNMWNTMASNGIRIDMSTEESRAKITAKAINNVMTETIVPQLKTSTVEFELLNNKLDGRFVKDIRGINLANMELAGNSYATQDLLQQIIDEVQPMSDEALENLAQGSTEVTSMINSLIAQGYSESAAKSYATQLFKTQKYSDQILRNGSITERMALINSSNRGINIYDPLQYNNYLGEAVNVDQMIGSWGPGYTSTINGVVTNTIGSATGVDYGRMWGAINITKNGITGTGVADLTDMTPEEYAKYVNKASSAFINDQNQTNTRLQDITVENMANEFAFFNEWLGHWAEVIEVAIKGIGAIILTKVVAGTIGKSLGLLGGTAAGGTGAGILSTAGGIALGTVGGVLAIAGISRAITDANKPKFGEHGVKEQEEEINGLFELTDDLKGAARVAASNSTDEDNGWWGNMWSDVSSAFQATGMGIGKAFHAISGASYDSDYTNRNKDFYESMVSKAIKGNTDRERTGLFLAYAYLLNEINSLETTDKLGQSFTKQRLKEIANGPEYEWYNVDHWVNELISGGYAPAGYHGEKGDDRNVKNYLRQGLNSVPYDNYAAYLHQGEAVLTATTANELRNLLDEYRNTSQQSINFDTIIQTQTKDLVQKMDEIIKVISSNYGNEFYNSPDQEKARNILTNSLTHIRSTKSF